jgi:hypothetical protein
MTSRPPSRRLGKIFHAREGAPQAGERDVLVTRIEACENRHLDCGPEDAVAAIRRRGSRKA